MNTKQFGGKTTTLVQLQDAGFCVPPFVAFSCQEIQRLSVEIMARRVVDQLPGVHYAVRSSALTEDTAQSSQAGQFLTRLDVSVNHLAVVIQEVLEDARKQLASMDQFSLLVMEFIEPDLAGVVFTRHPIEGREMIVEWTRGRGDAVVSGTKHVERSLCYRSHVDQQMAFPEMQTLLQQAIKIEQRLGKPQDIEWLIKDHQVFFVQSRPITTLAEDQTRASVFLDQTLPKTPFYFEKTEVCEVAPTPSDETFALLQSLYAEGGPVQHAYTDLGINFTDTQFLCRIGGQLYVDREKELHSLLPAYSYLSTNTYTPKPVTFKGIMRTWKNQRKLAGLRFNVSDLYNQIRDRLAEPGEDLFADYELIFLLNLAAEQMMQQLRRALPEDVSVAGALGMETTVPVMPRLIPPVGCVGNGLDLQDTSAFREVSFGLPTEQLLPGVSEDDVAHAQETSRLREYGRWLVVWHLSKQRRQQVMQEVFDVALPRVLTDRPMVRQQEALGVSAGQATGVLVTEETIDTMEGDKILFVEALTPQLVAYADRVKGIISDTGGTLSHFAILAREMGLPVIVHVAKQTLTFGSIVSINGSTGEIRKE